MRTTTLLASFTLHTNRARAQAHAQYRAANAIHRNNRSRGAAKLYSMRELSRGCEEITACTQGQHRQLVYLYYE